MATNATDPNQITTADINATLTPVAIPAAPVAQAAPAPAPQMMVAQPQAQTEAGAHPNLGLDSMLETPEQESGMGVDGEASIWEARYSMKNFLGRMVGLGVLVLAWIGLAVYTWGYSTDANTGLKMAAVLTGIALGIMAIVLARRVVLARCGHYYRLTNRRLFVSTGIFRRRRDQMELLQVQDVYTKQTLWQRFLSLGTVVVVSKEQHFPVMYLSGVEDPKQVMDLVWHQARTERDRRTVKIDSV